MNHELVINTAQKAITLGAEGDEEIVQNVRLIASTFAFSVRFDVPFASTGEYIDSPLPHNTARLMASLTTAIEQYEPRVKVLSIRFDARKKATPEATSQGIGYPVITVRRKEESIFA